MAPPMAFRARLLRELQDRYRRLLQERHESANAFRVVDELFEVPYMTAPRAARLLEVTTAGARGILERLAGAEILQRVPDMWPRLYVAGELLGTVESPDAASS